MQETYFAGVSVSEIYGKETGDEVTHYFLAIVHDPLAVRTSKNNFV